MSIKELLQRTVRESWWDENKLKNGVWSNYMYVWFKFLWKCTICKFSSNLRWNQDFRQYHSPVFCGLNTVVNLSFGQKGLGKQCRAVWSWWTLFATFRLPLLDTLLYGKAISQLFLIIAVFSCVSEFLGILRYLKTHTKQCRPWSDALFWSIWSGSTLFA